MKLVRAIERKAPVVIVAGSSIGADPMRSVDRSSPSGGGAT